MSVHYAPYGRSREKLLATLDAHAGRDFSREELMRLTGLKDRQLRLRLAELRAEKLCYVRQSVEAPQFSVWGRVRT